MNLNYLRYKLFKPFKSWKNKYLKHITKKQAKAYDLYNEVAREISDYTGESIGVVKQKHKLGPESESRFYVFKEQDNLNKDDVESFYKECSYYIYELPLWNAEVNRSKYLCLINLPYLRSNHYKKILDFGAGSGDLCIELAKNNLEITYCDIGDKLLDFVRWRFQKRALNIKIAKGIDNLGGELYDCIFSFDTFEHIKGLPLILQKLVTQIKIRGSLIFSGAFSGGTLHLEENEKYNEFKNLDTLMQNYGLTFQDKFAQFYFYKKTA